MKEREVYFELSSDDEGLYMDIKKMTFVHGRFDGKIFTSYYFREISGQMPYEINKVGMFSEGCFVNFDELRNVILDSPKETAIVVRDNIGGLVEVLYLGRQCSDDPFMRVVVKDKDFVAEHGRNISNTESL
jgi:hypothetical protein